MSAQELYVLKMWEDLVEYFKDFIKNTEKNKKNKEEKYELAFIEGYVKYVEAVCNIIKIENMNLSGITSLFNFINAVDKVIELEDNKLNCTRYTNTNKSYDHRQGRCFELQFVDGKLKDTWGWFGIYFNNQTVVCIEFNKEEGWGLPVYEKLQAKRKFTEGEYFAEPYEEDSAFYFELKKDVLEEFDELEDAEEQVEILNSFFKEVLEYIRK